MKYNLTVFGVKDMTETIVTYIHEQIRPVSLVVTISADVTKKNAVSGYKGLGGLTEKYGIPVFEVNSYAMTDTRTQDFFSENDFDLGISMGWQRLMPPVVLDAFAQGIFGFHGSSAYLPFGRGRSPLNWSLILGDTRFNLNLFRYDEKADSPNVFGTEMFSLTPHDDIRTAQYKNMICAKKLIGRLLSAYAEACENGGAIPINTASRDFDTWYEKRSAADGKIDFGARTRDIYNLIRGVAAPFPGAWATLRGAEGKKITIWAAHPFDEMIGFSAYAPGEVIDIFDGRLIIRTVDGSLIIEHYDYDGDISVNDILE